MVDVLTPEQRQRNMSRIRGAHTKPELIVRKLLHKQGFRYRLHRRDLPGCPDIVLPRYNTVIFVHGCFWHAHACPLAKMPATRTAFWTAKIAGNARRDQQTIDALHTNGWRVITVWECALRGRYRRDSEELASLLAEQVTSTASLCTISRDSRD